MNFKKAFLRLVYSSVLLGLSSIQVSYADTTLSSDTPNYFYFGSDNLIINSGVTISGGASTALDARGNGTITNNGTLTSNGAAEALSSFSTTTLSVVNNGTISNTANGKAIDFQGSLSSFTNNLTISSNDKYTITNVAGAATIAVLNNSLSGTISSNSMGWATIYNRYNITSLINAGSMTGSTGTIGSNYFGGNVILNDGGSIGSITNTGSINPGVGGYGIYNSGIITTLNNRQGASSTLSYTGRLPTNYNIVINSPTDYGKVVFTTPSATTSIGIYSTSLLNASTTYTSVITGLAANNITSGITAGTFSSGARSFNWSLINSSGAIWDLVVGLCSGCGPSSADTQTTIRSSAQKLRSVFNSSVISTNFANMNTYDCNLFDTKGMCISAGGRYTNLDSPNSNNTSAVVVVGYKASPHIRIGGFIDRSINNNTPTGIKVSNKNPLMGAFAVWNQQVDGLGLQVKLANAYQDKEVTTTRDVIGTSQAGTGATDLNTESYVGELSYGFLANQDKITLRPYFALRHTAIKQDAYTETSVANPLSYASLKDRSTTALVGLKLNYALTHQATLTASLGIEQDIEHIVGEYTATSADISGLTAENFNDNIKRTRPVASAGAYYTLSKTHRISGDVYYQQLPFQSTGSTTAYISYMIGL